MDPQGIPTFTREAQPRSGQTIKRKSKRVVLWTRRRVSGGRQGMGDKPNATERSRKARTEPHLLD